ncbi:MAG: biliverdin-producing heme oxygenase, partial [Pseudomonadota bacterium]
MTHVTAHAPDRTAHAILRAATDGAHRRVDALAAGLDLSRTADYRAFLLAQATALLPLEDALRDGGFATVCPGWRPRTPALRAAIDALGGRTAPGPAVPHGASPAALWGIAYVVEGSRLGGRLLAR